LLRLLGKPGRVLDAVAQQFGKQALRQEPNILCKQAKKHLDKKVRDAPRVPDSLFECDREGRELGRRPLSDRFYGRAGTEALRIVEDVAKRPEMLWVGKVV
jgi:hypothetical protein